MRRYPDLILFFLFIPFGHAADLGEKQVEVFSYAGTDWKLSSAPHASYRLNVDSITPLSSGLIQSGHYFQSGASAAVVQSTIRAGSYSPEGQCSNLLQSNQSLAIREMVERGVVEASDVKTLEKSFVGLDVRQITFVLVKSLIQSAEPLPVDGIYRLAREEIAPVQIRKYLNTLEGSTLPIPSERQYWKTIGSSWLVAGQVSGRSFPLPLETTGISGFPGIDRQKFPLVYELGRAARVDDITLQNIFPFIAERVLWESIALGVEPDQITLFAHTVQDQHRRLYERYGARTQWTSQDGKEALLSFNYGTLEKLFSPRRYGLQTRAELLNFESGRQQMMTRLIYPSGAAAELRFFSPKFRALSHLPESHHREWETRALSIR
ncbi:MAG: hypothetical protein EOP09_04360, partial [Proteobacteria bacterium]